MAWNLWPAAVRAIAASLLALVLPLLFFIQKRARRKSR
jgi:hypothetical protein